MDMSGGIDGWEVAGHGGLVKRQLLGNLLGRPKSLLDNLLNPQRPTTTSEETLPPETTSQAQQPPPAPTTTSPEPQQQQPTPPPAPPPSPSPTPVNTPTPAPAPPPPPPPSSSSQPPPSPSPPPLPTTTSQPPRPAPTPIPRFSNILPAQPSAIVSRPTPEEAHQSLPALNPLPTQEADILPPVVSSISPSSTTRLSLLPTSGPGEPQEKGAVGKEGNSGMEFTQRLGLGLGLAMFMVVVVVSAVFICRWRRRICKKRKQDANMANTTYPPDLKIAMAPPPPVLDPEIGIRHIHEHHHFHNMDEQPTLPNLREYEPSQYDRQASTAAWAEKLQEPSSPVESEKEAETGIIRIFRWPTMASRSDITALTRRSAGGSASQQFKDAASWTSRASRSTLSTMLWRSRRSIARRRGEDGGDSSAAEEESGILRDAQPTPVIERKPVPAREPAQQLLTVKREKSRRHQRESSLTVSSAGGGSIASSGVLSPTLMAFPVPPKGASTLSMVLTSRDSETLPPPLPATVYKPYKP